MPATSAKAFGKIILFGEHAVVYGQAAIAIPVTKVYANVTIRALPGNDVDDIRIVARDIGLISNWKDLSEKTPLHATLTLVRQHFMLDHLPPMEVNIHSTIPVASGMGSGAAVTTALIRAIAGFLGRRITIPDLSAMVFVIEKLHHGNPSGIDNTVIAFEKPVFYIKENPPEYIKPGKTLIFLIAISNRPSKTIEVVNEVRSRYQEDPAKFQSLFHSIGEVAWKAKEAIMLGNAKRIGALMDENQCYLDQLSVTSDELEKLIKTARQHGALGAKLSGAGKGGNIIALCEREAVIDVQKAVLAAGAIKVIETELKAED